MKTYQELLSVGDNEQAKMDFVEIVIGDHEGSQAVRIARDAELYYRHLNPTIMKAQKFIYNVLGQRVEDLTAANNKIPSRLFFYFVTQEVQFLLGNGVSFGDENTKIRLGENFDQAVMELATKAIVGGVSFGYWNNDHLEVFPIAGSGSEPCFAPIYDEENGALMAGVRYWRIDSHHPLRATLYEQDGYTEYIKRAGEDMTVMQEKRSYVSIVSKSDATGTEIYGGHNWPTLPIVPMFNINRQSDIIGGRETLDAYDLMSSALINNVDDGNIIYWVIKNAGAMDDEDDAEFVRRLKTVHVAHVDGSAGTEIESKSIEAPFEANENALERLRSQLFDDFMALDVKEIAGGAATATQIKAAYEPLNSKCDLLEYQVTDFIRAILNLLGIDDSPTYTRSVLVNRAEEIQNLTVAAQYLSEDYVTRKILEIMGDTDKANDIIAQREAEEGERYTMASEAQSYSGGDI